MHGADHKVKLGRCLPGKGRGPCPHSLQKFEAEKASEKMNAKRSWRCQLSSKDSFDGVPALAISAVLLIISVLRPCLNGQGKTLMVVNVGPEMEHAHETLCSLRFASQASLSLHRMCKSCPCRPICKIWFAAKVSQCNTGGKPKRCVRPVTGPKATGRHPCRKPNACLACLPRDISLGALLLDRQPVNSRRAK